MVVGSYEVAQGMDEPFVGYDIIGDVHGCYASLLMLLDRLGYVKRNGVFTYHNTKRPRQAIFLGDLTDRGPQIREAVLTVRAMVERGDAVMLLGNHEYNAAGYVMPRASGDGFVYEHCQRHEALLAETLEQFANHPNDWRDATDWFTHLPMFMQFQHFRAVHACWDSRLIGQYLQQHESAELSPQFLKAAGEPGSFASRFLGRITRGVSLPLPDNQCMSSSDGIKRRRFRAKFWVEKPDTYGDVEFQPDALPNALAKQLISDADRKHMAHYRADQRPLFVGHYWQRGVPRPLSANIACLDYSAVKAGQLVAYRMDNEQYLSADKFVSVPGLNQE